MKKVLAVTLAALSFLLLAIPAAATHRERVGPQINVLLGTPTTFPAGAPFSISHGWGAGPPEQLGILSFRLDVDGVPREEDFVSRVALPLPPGPPDLLWIWVHNFPDGMTGTHTFTGHWIAPCEAAVEFHGFPGPCRTPNEPVEAITRSLTVTFTP